MKNIETREKVIQVIRDAGFFIDIDQKNINLFTDIGIDSFTFVSLLVQIEDIFEIEFDVLQMESCADLNMLVLIANEKITEKAYD